MIVYNHPGILILCAGFAIALGAYLWRGERAYPGYWMAIAWIALDLLYRSSFPVIRLIHPAWGGHIYFVPLWVLGLLTLGCCAVARWKSHSLRAPGKLDKGMFAAPAHIHPRPAPDRSVRLLSHKAARWSIPLVDSYQRFTSGQHLYFFEQYPPEYYKLDKAFDLVLTAVDCLLGEKQVLPPLTVRGRGSSASDSWRTPGQSSFTAGQATVLDGVIFANAGNRLARLNVGADQWQTVAEHADGTMTNRPLCIKGTVVCAWHSGKTSVVVSRTTNSGTAWSDAIPGDYVRALVGVGDRVYLFADYGDAIEMERRTIVYGIDVDSLDILHTKTLPFMASAVAFDGETLCSAGHQNFLVLPPGPVEKVGDGPRSFRKDFGHQHPRRIVKYLFDGNKQWTAMQDTGGRGVPTLMCQAAPGLTILSVQPLAADPEDISLLDGQIIVTSHEHFQCAIERIENPSGRLVPVAWCPGKPVGAPAQFGDTLVWLINDSSVEEPFGVTCYRLLSWSLTTNRTQTFTFDCGKVFEVLLASGPDTLLLVSDAFAVALSVHDLGLNAGTAVGPGPTMTSRGGPRIDLWAYDHPDSFLAGILGTLIQDPDRFWEHSAEERIQALYYLRDYWIREILMRVPTPQDLSVSGEGDLGQLPPHLLPAARFLLFDFIRENKHSAAIDQHVWPHVHSPFFREVLSWANREALHRADVLPNVGQLSLKWATGAVALFDDWRRYRDLVCDLFECELLGGAWLSPLEDALQRVWSHPGHPNRTHAFISYSHRDLEAARRLTEGLRCHGVKVAFDRWQPDTSTDERQVEMWIAENVLNSGEVVYLVSSNALESGWIRRESEWERRLLGLRQGFRLPLLIGLDPSVAPEEYPSERLFDGRGLLANDDGLIKVIAERILS